MELGGGENGVQVVEDKRTSGGAVKGERWRTGEGEGIEEKGSSGSSGGGW